MSKLVLFILSLFCFSIIPLPYGTVEGEFRHPRLETASVTQSIEETGGADSVRVYYPAGLGDDSYPVIVFGNGTGLTYKWYDSTLSYLASFGFIVVDSNDTMTREGDSILAITKYIIDEGRDPDSVFFGKVDEGAIGLIGHSQGASSAADAAVLAEDFSYASLALCSMPENNAVNSPLQVELSDITIPVFLCAGTRVFDAAMITPLRDLQLYYDSLTDSPLVCMSRNRFADHQSLLYHGGGSQGAYVAAWFCATLKNDETALSVFTGDSPEICSNPRWCDSLVKSADGEHAGQKLC